MLGQDLNYTVLDLEELRVISMELELLWKFQKQVFRDKHLILQESVVRDGPPSCSE